MEFSYYFKDDLSERVEILSDPNIMNLIIVEDLIKRFLGKKTISLRTGVSAFGINQHVI